MSEEKTYSIESKGRLIGTEILLDEASVTGTANIIMASVLAEGNTSIYNAACEPYIQQLCSMLNNMGADITGIGSNLLSIKGVEKLNGTTHNILPDMIEIGSWIGLAAMTRSKLRIKNISWKNLGQIPDVFRKLGITIQRDGDDMIIPEHKDGYSIANYIDGSILTISDAPWPGFSPDLISVILVVATQAKGSVLVHQKMFESRLFFVDKLIDMGYKVGADYIVMSDYPGEPARKTIDKAREMAPELRAHSFGTFFVPQGKAGSIDDLLGAFGWASTAEEVDYIGVSILAVPLAYGVEKENKLQRFLSRWKFMQLLDEYNILQKAKDNGKKIHFLGMVDGPNEIQLVKEYLWAIDTWDSSAAVWAGLCDILFDNSPTGLIEGKNEIEVDFSHRTGENIRLGKAAHNMRYIDTLLEEYSR